MLFEQKVCLISRHRCDRDRSQMLAIRNFGDWYTVFVEVPWSSVPKTTMDCHSKLVLHS